MSYFIMSFIVIFLCILIFLMRISKKSLIVIVLCSMFIVQIILQPKISIDAAILGSKLFFYKVFPSLFPFLVISNIIVLCGGISIYSKLFGVWLCKPLRLPLRCSFVIIISMLCGYPIGAKYACDLLEKGLISTKTCQRLLSIATNASPLFVIGSVGTSMMKDTNIGYILLLANLLSCFVMAFLMPAEESYVSERGSELDYGTLNIGDIMKSSIDNALKTSISIGGFVIIFCVINSIIKSNIIFNIALNNLNSISGISKGLIEGFILGLIEMTNGCYLLATSSASIFIKIPVISFLITFSGLSIITQVYSFTYKYPLSIGKYTCRKLIQGIIAALFSIGLYKLSFGANIKSVFSTNSISLDHVFLTTLMILLALPLIISALKNLLKAP